VTARDRNKKGMEGLGGEGWAAVRRQAEEEMAALGMPAAQARAEAEKRTERVRLRVEWARERLDQFFEMQDRAGEAYVKQIEAHPDVDWEDPDAPVLPEPPEAAVAEAIYAEVRAALDEDRWPRHLHSHDV
jgi:hypothetical protein